MNFKSTLSGRARGHAKKITENDLKFDMIFSGRARGHAKKITLNDLKFDMIFFEGG